MRLFSNHYLGRGADPDDEVMFADEFFYAIDVDNSMEIDFSEFLWFMLWQVGRSCRGGCDAERARRRSNP